MEPGTCNLLSDVPWRWQRGIARALLLTGALAGMTLGTVAQAQIAFRAASSATQPVPTFRAASSATAVFPAPAPTFVSAGAVATGAAAITPALPASILVDDILLLFLETSNQAITIFNQSGGTWTAVTNSPQSTGVALALDATRLTVFWSRYNGTQTAPVTSDSGNRQLGRIIAVRGVIPTGNPWDITAGGVEAGNTDNSGSIPGATTTVVNTLVVAAIGTSLPDLGSTTVFSLWANVDLTGVTERTDNSSIAGVGGGLGIATGVKATAGLYAATTVTTSVATAKAMMSIALRTATATLTITKPALTAQNDVMIASFGFRTNQPGLSSDILITPPSGWTLVNRRDNPDTGDGGTDNGLAVYRKTAGASEPANYTWSLSCGGTGTCATAGFQGAEGGIVSFYNVDTTSASPINVEASAETVMGAQTTPDVTTSVANAMLVTSHTFASAGTWTPPTGMTEAVDVTSGSQATLMSYVLQAAAAPTGPRQAFPSLDDDAGNAHILALRPAQQSSITINKPAGTVQNDVMIASIGFRPNTLTVTPPVGWTIVRRIDTTDTSLGGAPSSLEVYWLTAGAGEPANYTWTASAAGYLAGGILSFSGVDTAAATPIDIDAGNCTLQGGCANLTLSHATPSVTTTMANTMLVTSHAYASAGTWTPTGMTEAVDVQHGNQSLSVNYVAQAAAGATGTKTATASSDADIGTAHILALKPVPSVGGFNAYETSTGAGAITGVIKTKIAGASVSVDMIALNAAKTAIATTFTGTVRVEVLDASNNSGGLDGNNCRSTWAVIQTLSPDPAFISGDNGRKTISFTQANSYPDARLRITYPAGAPTVTGCSTDNFAIRPNTFASYSVTDSNATTAGTTRTLNNVAVPGGLFHNAGRPFTVQATAVNAVPATTTNYTGSPTGDLTNCAPAGNACTATFGTFTLGASFAAGVLTSNVATYNDAGSFNLQLVDSTFSNVDAGDGSTLAERNITSAVINVGRFVPDHFAVALTPPEFGTACGAGGFTYIGQPFNYTTQPVITVTAQNFANGTTTRYTGALWQITNASLTSKSYTAATGGAPDTSGLPGTDPVIVDSGGGAGTLTFGSGTGLFFTRTTPVAPFNADISLAINVIDADGISYASNPARFGTATAGNGIAFSSGKAMRFGRLAIRNANGSQLMPLPVQLEAQYWSGAPTNAFITNTQDSCTSIASANDAMGNYTANLSGSPTCETAVSGGGTLSAGRKTLQLAAPGSGNNGSVDLTVNLGASASGNTCTTLGGAPVSATTANLPHLQGNWTGGAYTVNPSARATFGVFKGAEEVIFVRENF